MKNIIEILVGAFVGVIYLKPVVGAYEFPSYIEPNQVKILTDAEPAHFQRGTLEENYVKPSWLLHREITNHYGVYIITRQASYKTKEWINRMWQYPTAFNNRIHKPEKVYFRLGTENFIAEGFTEYGFVSPDDPLYYLKTINRIYIVFPTGKVWTAKVQDYSEYVKERMRMELASASSSSNPQMKKTGK